MWLAAINGFRIGAFGLGLFFNFFIAGLALLIVAMLLRAFWQDNAKEVGSKVFWRLLGFAGCSLLLLYPISMMLESFPLDLGQRL